MGSVNSNILQQGPLEMKTILLLLSYVFLCQAATTKKPKTGDAEFSLDVLKEKADYDNLCYGCSVDLVHVNGGLETYDTYSTVHLAGGQVSIFNLQLALG